MGAAPALAARPFIHAHRGGSIVNGTPRWPESTLPAFRHSARQGFVLELDVKLTRDAVPVVIHDATLDRTTPCTGRVADKTLAELRASCDSDILGSAGNSVQLAPGDRRRAPIPTLREVLELARDTGARLNLEIKNLPTDPDFDPTDAFADRVMDTITDPSIGFPLSRLIIQSFWPPNLDAAKARLPDVETSLLAAGPGNEGTVAFAKRRGYDWLSPQWPTTSDLIAKTHAAGLRIVPYTLDTAAEIDAAARAGVDELITNDPTLARRVVAAAEPSPAPIPPPPSQAACRAARAGRSLGTIEAYGPHRHGLRVFAMQPKQEVRNAETYASFRTKIECLIRERVLPRLAHGEPNVVAFNEDIGLMTIATGSRGAEARALASDPASVPGCAPGSSPCAAIKALLAVGSAYSNEITAYGERFGHLGPFNAAFVGTTDTFARGWMQVFSDMARRYGIYILGSNDQSPFRESVDPSEIAAFRDPDVPTPSSVFVATSQRVYNEVFMWGPRNVRSEGPRPLRNVVAQNRKVPLTDIELGLGLTNGPSHGPDAVENLRPFHLPGSRARIGFATSLPAFVYGDPPAGADPCSDTSKYYMRCLDRLGANLVMQDEANPGRWATDAGSGVWQPLEWMTSTWRAVDDPSVGFDYNVTPHLVGNLVDLPFDGQTAITQRGLRGRRHGRGCNYVGDSAFLPEDPASLAHDAGPKREFLALAPWVTADAPRSELRAIGAKLDAGSRDPLENDYVETAIAADLPFPPEPNRPGCLGQSR